MITRRTERFTARSGFTLLEMMISVSIFAVLGYALLTAVDIAHDSDATVIRISSEDRSVRTSTTSLLDELRSTSDANITVATLADGNHRVRFTVPVTVAGVLGWGVYDRSLGHTPDDQNKVGWSLQYTVRSVTGTDGKPTRELVRQILDAAGSVHSETVLVRGLRSGTQTPAGFKVVRSGDLWEITLSTNSTADHSAVLRTVFHVKTRN
jgi:prepilin-type N-terminal cleavage/methylation domain-containing protein